MREKKDKSRVQFLPDELWRYIISFFSFQHELTKLKQCSIKIHSLIESPGLNIPYAKLDYSKKLFSEDRGTLKYPLSMANCFALLSDNTFLTTDGPNLYRVPLPLNAGKLPPLNTPTYFKGNKSYITELCLLSSERVVTGSHDGTLFLWDIKDGTYINTLLGHSKAITQIIKFDDDTILSASEDKSIRLWNLKTWASEKLASLHKSVNQLIKIDNTKIICSIGSQTIALFDIIEKKWIGTPLNCKFFISQLCLTEPDTLLVGGSFYGESYEETQRVKVYNIRNDSFYKVHSIRHDEIRCFAGLIHLLPDNKVAFISRQGPCLLDIIDRKKLTIYDLNTQKFIAEYPLKNNDITGLSVLKDNRLAVYNSKYTLFSFARENNKHDSNHVKEEQSICPIM